MASDQIGESRDVGTLLHGERQVLEMIATGAPLSAVLDALCRDIDARSGLRSSIFLLDAAGEHLRLMAGPGLPAVWRQAVSVLTDPLYRDFRAAAVAAGIRAVWSTPFLSKDRRALGTFRRGGGTVGVGIAGMCERLEQLGGRLEVESGDHGTTVRAWLPLLKDAG